MSVEKKSNHNRQLSRTVSQNQTNQVNNSRNTTNNTHNSHNNHNNNSKNNANNKVIKNEDARSINIEDELATLDLETFDDLVYSLGIFDNISETSQDTKHQHQHKDKKSPLKDNSKKALTLKPPSFNPDNNNKTSHHHPEKSKKTRRKKSSSEISPDFHTHQKQQEPQILSIADSTFGIGSDLSASQAQTAAFLGPAGISKTLQGLLTEPAAIIYGTLPVYNETELLILNNMDNNIKNSNSGGGNNIISNNQSKLKTQANGTIFPPQQQQQQQIGQGPSGSRNHLATIPGSISNLSTHEANNLRSELIVAVEQNKVEKVRRILANGVDANAVCDTSGRWPIHIAALLGHSAIAKILLDYGAQKDQPDTNLERTPLLYAATSSPETVLTLLNYRVDIKSRNKFGANALHYAAGAGQGDCCKLLASAGCDVNARDRQKMTPLHMAARVDDIYSIEVLLSFGADIHAKDINGKSALHHAAETAEGMESDLNKMGATFRKLISAGVSVNGLDVDGKTALYYAIQTGSPDAVTCLFELGAELTDGVSLLSMGRKFPALIRPFLDKCVSSNIDTCDAESKHFYIQFDYTCLTFYPKDIQNDKLLSMQNREETESVLQETGVLHGLTRCKDTSILSHPVCESLLRLKWKKVKWYLYLDMLLFAVFLAFLTAVIFMEYESDNTAAAELEGNMTMMAGTDGGAPSFPSPNTGTNGEGGEGGMVPESHRVSYCMDSTRNIIVWSILWGLTGCLGVREFIQLIQAPLHYVVQIENMLELVLVFSVAMLSLAECGVESFVDTRDHFAAVCLIVGWTIQVTLYGKIPVFGVYIRMFAAVATNVLKCMFTYLGLLFAFSLTLHFLFRTHKEFDSVGFTFLKTFAMMIGEIELARTFIDRDKNTTIVPFTSHLMFALFIIFISVILMSLLQALAVCDISKMQNEGEYMQLVQQVKVASQLEDALQHRSLLYPQFGQNDIRSLHQRKGVIFPNLKDHGKLSKDALEIVFKQHTKKIDSSGVNTSPGQVAEHTTLIRATNEVADDLLLRLKNKMEKYAFDVEKRSDKMIQDIRGRQETGVLQLNREVLLIKTLLEDMNTSLRELSITVKTLGERSEDSSSSSRASISGRKSRGNQSNDASTITDSQATSPESVDSPEPIDGSKNN